MFFRWFPINIILLFSVGMGNAYKILVFSPKISNSQVKFMGNVADIMAEAGHDVTVLLTETAPFVTINGTKLAKIVIIPAHPEVAKIRSDQNLIRTVWDQENFSLIRIYDVFTKLTNMLLFTCSHVLKHQKVLEQLKNERFDIALMQAYDPCPLGLTEVLRIPTHVVVSSTALPDYYRTVVGAPNIPSYMPAFIASYTDQMSYFQRVVNMASFVITNCVFSIIVQKEQDIFRHHFGKNFVDLDEKMIQSAYIITNRDPFIDYPLPTIHKVLEIGGFTVPRKHHLNEIWTKIMEQRKKVVLVSFGSVALSHLMPDSMKKMFLKTFDEFPNVTFIWKYEKEEDHIADGHPNVITSRWLPQTDILAHPNLVAFVTHGGMNSITETLNIGKPVIAIPIFADQMRNAVMVKRLGLGEVLTIAEVATDGKLKNTLMQMLTSNRYIKKADKLKRMIAERPNPSREQLIKHIEFAAKFGTVTNFDPYGRKLSFFQYYMLDIIIPFLLLALFILVTIFYSLVRLIKMLVNKKKMKFKVN